VPWSEVLARVQQAVLQAVAATAEREQKLAALPPVPLAAGSAARQQALDQLQARFQALEACAAGAQGRVAAVDAALAEGEAALRQWLTATGAARGKLAEWVGRAVG
jgi:hypothetical protein